MTKTIFNTPIVTPVLRLFVQIIFKLTGWRVKGEMPDAPKFVILGAPHTSNWDFLIFVGLALFLRSNIQYMGKSQLFDSPFGFFFRYCGGIPVYRNQRLGMVEQIVERFDQAKGMILAIAPEGTRQKVDSWKTGFYHIAKNANVPIVAGYVDGGNKTVGVGPLFTLTDNMEEDIKQIKAFYKEMWGIHKARTSLLL